METAPPENQVIPYEAPWNIFAVSFSNNSHYPFRLGVASFLAENTNYVDHVGQTGSINSAQSGAKFRKEGSFLAQLPPNKATFYPRLSKDVLKIT